MSRGKGISMPMLRALAMEGEGGHSSSLLDHEISKVEKTGESNP